jgi:hypothetical protein
MFMVGESLNRKVFKETLMKKVSHEKEKEN